MPVEFQIIRAAEFLRMGTQGEFDLVTSCAVLAELARACRLRGIDRALLDVRLARAPLAPAEIAALVNTFREIGFTQSQRLAILHSGDPFRRARMFAFISRMRGWKVRAFGDFEEALSWLSAEKEQTSRTRSPSKQVLPVDTTEGPAHAHAHGHPVHVMHASKRRPTHTSCN